MENSNIPFLEAKVAGLENEIDRLKLELKTCRILLIRWSEVTGEGFNPTEEELEDLRDCTKFLIK